jgi:hypothetical protein
MYISYKLGLEKFDLIGRATKLKTSYILQRMGWCYKGNESAMLNLFREC